MPSGTRNSSLSISPGCVVRRCFEILLIVGSWFLYNEKILRSGTRRCGYVDTGVKGHESSFIVNGEGEKVDVGKLTRAGHAFRAKIYKSSSSMMSRICFNVMISPPRDGNTGTPFTCPFSSGSGWLVRNPRRKYSDNTVPGLFPSRSASSFAACRTSGSKSRFVASIKEDDIPSHKKM
jgi:hypothetical protein